jgi:hypothetical protein
MPVISRFFGIVIMMFYGDHNPPHFHVRYNEFSGTININTLELYEGKLPKRVYNMVVEWAIEHRKELQENWERTKDGKEPNKIEGLE